MSLASMLSLTAQLNTFLLENKIHSTLFPFPILTTLHALRISLIYRFLSSKSRRSAPATEQHQKPTWAYDIFGFLIMCWGGGFIVNFMLGQTPVQLLSIYPFINYVSVHVFLTILLNFLEGKGNEGNLINMKFFDSSFFLLDGCLRSQAVIMSILTVKNNSQIGVKNSLLIQILSGTIGATGGGQLAGMFGILSPTGNWQFSTPPFLRARSIVEVIDILAAALASIVYGLTTLSHPDYAPFLAKVYSSEKSRPLFTPIGARAACTIVFALAFAYRATVLHWLQIPSTKPQLKPSKSSTVSTPKRSASPSKRSRSKEM